MEGTRIVLVRHGQSVVQVEDLISGHAGCRGLTELGRRQVVALGERLRSTGELDPVGAVYASAMRRAVETAETLAEAVGPGDVVSDCAFCELHPSDACDGRPWDDIPTRYPITVHDADPEFRCTPDGETWAEMAGRVAAGLEMLADRHRGETVVVACHGGVVVHSLVRWLGLGPGGTSGPRPWFYPENASITEWCYARVPHRTGAEGWRLVRFNDHAHL